MVTSLRLPMRSTIASSKTAESFPPETATKTVVCSPFFRGSCMRSSLLIFFRTDFARCFPQRTRPEYACSTTAGLSHESQTGTVNGCSALLLAMKPARWAFRFKSAADAGVGLLC